MALACPAVLLLGVGGGDLPMIYGTLLAGSLSIYMWVVCRVEGFPGTRRYFLTLALLCAGFAALLRLHG